MKVRHADSSRGSVEVFFKCVLYERVVVVLPLFNRPEYPTTAVDFPASPDRVILCGEVDVYEGVPRKYT